MLNVTTITTTLADSVNRIFGITTKNEHANGLAQVRKAMDVAYAAFAAENKIWVESLFDKHFFSQHGESIVTDYLNGLRTREQATSDLAQAWENHLVAPGIQMNNRQRAAAVEAADRYLAYLPE